MSKRKKKRGNKAEPDSYLNLVTAILNLVIAILLLIEKLTGKGQGEKSPLPSKNNTKCAQCQTTMTTVIYVLCGVSITLSAISIFINAKRRRQNGRGKKKD